MAALYAKRAGDGGEDGDHYVDDFLDGFLFHFDECLMVSDSC